MRRTKRRLDFFGGMPARIVPDNLKTVVVSGSETSPRFNDAFVDYAQARGLFVDPARVRKPRDKARVENQVAYVRESWFQGEVFTSLDHSRRSALAWCRDVAGTRVLGTTRRVPHEHYETAERTHMLPPPAEPFRVLAHGFLLIQAWPDALRIWRVRACSATAP